jgi:hypothetical protein
MFRFGVILVAIAVLLGLTALAFAALDKLPHPVRVGVTLSGALALGTWFLLDCS